MGEEIRQTGLPYNDRAAKQLLMCRRVSSTGFRMLLSCAAVLCFYRVMLLDDVMKLIHWRNRVYFLLPKKNGPFFGGSEVQ